LSSALDGEAEAAAQARVVARGEAGLRGHLHDRAKGLGRGVGADRAQEGTRSRGVAAGIINRPKVISSSGVRPLTMWSSMEASSWSENRLCRTGRISCSSSAMWAKSSGHEQGVAQVELAHQRRPLRGVGAFRPRAELFDLLDGVAVVVVGLGEAGAGAGRAGLQGGVHPEGLVGGVRPGGTGCAGLGVAPLGRILADADADADADPVLIRCSDCIETAQASSWIVTRRELKDTPRIRAFIDFLVPYVQQDARTREIQNRALRERVADNDEEPPKLSSSA
jgi:DNA-binding transcriptional LysR family regulator